MVGIRRRPQTGKQGTEEAGNGNGQAHEGSSRQGDLAGRREQQAGNDQDGRRVRRNDRRAGRVEPQPDQDQQRIRHARSNAPRKHQVHDEHRRADQHEAGHDDPMTDVINFLCQPLLSVTARRSYWTPVVPFSPMPHPGINGVLVAFRDARFESGTSFAL